MARQEQENTKEEINSTKGRQYTTESKSVIARLGGYDGMDKNELPNTASDPLVLTIVHMEHTYHAGTFRLLLVR